MAGGRELHLRSLQPLALHLANSLFLGDYLTSEGQAARADLEMIADAGFRVLSEREQPPEDQHSRVAVRRRGAGTGAAPNA
jgi:biotin synthase